MKINYSLLKEIYGSPWLLSELGREINVPILAGIFNEKIEVSPEPTVTPFTISNIAGEFIENDDDVVSSENSQISGKIGVITIKGTLTKEDQFCGPAGMKRIGAWMLENDANPEIGSHVFIFDTPGSSVVGTEELGNIIKNLQKPKVAFVEDLCCSGGMWLASYCDKIIANNTTSVVGSIGVMLSFADEQPYYESLGVKFHHVNAPQSSEKNKTFLDLKEGKYEDYQENVLRPLADKFINIIKENRPAVTADQLTGKVYFAQDAIGTLVDEIGDFNTAVGTAYQLSLDISATDAENGTDALNLQTPKNQISMNVEGLKKVTGADISVTENGVVLSAEQVTAIEAFITTADDTSATAIQNENRISELETEASSHQQTIEAVQATVAERDGTISQLQAQVAELSGKAGAESAIAVSETDAAASSSEELPFMRLARLRDEIGK